MANTLTWNSEKHAAWRAVIAGRETDFKNHLLEGGDLSREQFLIGWDKGQGAPLVAAWESASDTRLAPDPSDPSSQSLDKKAVPAIGGDAHMTLDAFKIAAGDSLRERNPELTQAAAVAKWCESDDGKLAYEIGKAIGVGSRFEDHPNQMRRGLAVVVEAVRRGADFESHPVCLKFSALLKASAE